MKNITDSNNNNILNVNSRYSSNTTKHNYISFIPNKKNNNNNYNTFKSHFNYIIRDTRPLNSPIKINIMSPDEKYYFIGQYNEYATNILFNEVVYGKIKVKYK